MHSKKKNILSYILLILFMLFMSYDTYKYKALNVYYGYYIELKFMTYPVVIFFLIASLYFLYLVVLEIFTNKTISKSMEYSKCPKCKKDYYYGNLKDGMCPKCNIKTIGMDEYFKLYPDE